MIPRLKPYYNHKEIIAALTPSKGNIEKYEEEFSQKFECRYGVMFPYGRSAIYALLKVWGLQNAEIICPAYTCVVVQHAIVLSDNIPVFVDCEEGSFNMSYAGIENVITPATRAIIITHLFGYPMDVHKVQGIVAKAEKKYGHKIYVVQDAAHSFGAKWDGELVTKYGDAAIFGMNISKIINSIFGGMAITNSRETYDKLVTFRENNFKRQSFLKTIKRFTYLLSVYFAFNKHIYSFVNFLERNSILDKFVKYYDESKIYFPGGWNQYPAEIEARIGLVQLSKYDKIVANRIKHSKNWIEKLSGNDEIRLFPDIEGATYSHFVALVENRDDWIKRYRKKGIQLGILIEYSIPEMKVYEKYKRGEYPISKYYSERTINFPIWAGKIVS